MTHDRASRRPPSRPAPRAADALPGLARVAAVGLAGTRRVGRAGPRRSAGRRVVGARHRPDRGGARWPATLGVRRVESPVGDAGPVGRRAACRSRRPLTNRWRGSHRPSGRDRAVRRRRATASGRSLRERGASSCDRSRDVWNDERRTRRTPGSSSELAPDEARILLLLLEGGPQPSVDVRTGGPVGHGQLAADRARADHDRRRARAALPRPGAVLPQQPVPARPGLVLARAARGPDGVPGRRGPARRARRRCTRCGSPRWCAAAST